MANKPILFSTEMVQAILKGTKTQTRRIIKKPIKNLNFLGWNIDNYNSVAFGNNDEIINKIKTPIKKGDILWVRETSFQILREHAHDLLEGARGGTSLTVYKTDFHDDWMAYAKEKYGYKWKPSIFMPKQACRIWLKVTNVRVERLQDISKSDAIAEGIKKTWISDNEEECKFKNYINNGKGSLSPLDSFLSLWESINGKSSLEYNPWVWVYEFERCEMPKDFFK